MDVDLRLVRYFTVVAEHGNVHRAATALRIAQPSLSRQIQRLEAGLGVRLFDRTNRGSRLTAAGEAYLAEARGLLRAAERARNRARAAADPGTLVIGYTGNLPVTAAVRELRLRYPRATVHTRHLLCADVRPALLDRRVGAVLARLPFPSAGLDLGVLYEHPRVLVMPADHRLAGRDAVTLADFADVPLVRYADPALDAYWRVDPRPDGAPAPDGPLALTVEDKLELVATGDALTLAPADERPDTLRSDLTAVPVRDLPPSTVVLATRAGTTDPMIDDLRTVLTPR
ncbi:LysR family transcriptional regulator [Pseudosporangium ferrugineum]|uniref:DNA-binding transcriptional LysR family regulator n=1 Tax=Pseudosporangium ferrugineum TaxID=439699 RepID=A0A2T0SF03_9ACTN|nr:LysR family transcriptional regulator [Pseudosporangium ferrugineum]PRY32008.1 DNA-binding transcriptional LysR family regulator [Pseudosporangium ferrugineum]